MNDTSPDITALVHTRLMAKTGAERFLMGVRMHEAARRMVIASLPATLSPQELRQQLQRRLYADADVTARRTSHTAGAGPDFSAAC